jgi:iron(III) transport system substrate-binding protein
MRSAVANDKPIAGRRPAALAVLASALVVLAACSPLDAGLRRIEAAQLAAAAEREGEVVVYTNTGPAEAGPMLNEFHRRHPGIRLRFERQNSAELYEGFRREVGQGTPSADVVWSSAMDLQIKLINDGYAQPYISEHRSALPTWAVWKNEGYGVTAEPIVFVYDRRRIAPAAAPRSHLDLKRQLEAGRLPGPIATFDPERSAVGFLYFAQDRLAWADAPDLDRAMGARGVTLVDSTATLLDRMAAGQNPFGYNVIGSYALERQALDPNLVVVFPEDYTLLMSRIAFVAAHARHPAAAKLFLDFMLSQDGQRLLARSRLRPVREDVAGPGPPGPDARVARPIAVGPSLLANLDQMRRTRLLATWSADIGPARTYDLRRTRDSFVTGPAP